MLDHAAALALARNPAAPLLARQEAWLTLKEAQGHKPRLDRLYPRAVHPRPPGVVPGFVADLVAMVGWGTPPQGGAA